MTRADKKTAMTRLSKRIDRFYSWVEYYNFSEPHRLMTCALRGVAMVNQLKILASQPIDEHKLSFKERVQQLSND